MRLFFYLHKYFITIIFGCQNDAGIAQLVERNLAKVDVAGSSPVSRSNYLSVSNPISKRELGFDKAL